MPRPVATPPRLSRRSFLRGSTAFAAGIMAVTASAAADAGPEHPATLSPASFRARPEAARALAWEKPDLDLIAAAIFHETNKRRIADELDPLLWSAGAARSARWQAEVMAREKIVDHENPVDPELRTLPDRVRRAGLQFRFAAENVALAFALRYEAGREFFTDKGPRGRVEFRYTEKGPPIATHTPLSFAEALLNQWMESPGHRENILRKTPTHLGCHASPALNEMHMPVFYAAQVFVTPSNV